MKLKQIGSNQTELHLDNGTIVLFSYETPVASKHEACREYGFVGVQRTKRIYSRTTTRHINKWIKSTIDRGETIHEVDQSVLDELVGNKFEAVIKIGVGMIIREVK